MLRLPRFRYLAPRSLDEAVRLLAEHGPQAMLVAGGTDVYPKMKRRQFGPSVLVGLARVPGLGRVEGDGASGIAIGALSMLSSIATDPMLRKHYPAIPEAAEVISTPPLRNMGTLGGNLCVDTRCTYYDQTYPWRASIDFCLKKDGDTCWVAPGSPRCLAVSSSDLAPVMIALGARYELLGPEGARAIEAEDFYRDDGSAYIAKKPGELLARVRVGPAGGWRSTYAKLRRRGAFDFPVMGAAVAVRVGPNDEIENARIVVGGIASAPVFMEEASRVLAGKRPSETLIREAAALTFRPAKALDNTDLAPLYRKKMVPIFVERCLRKLLL
ncbi:MAG: FAD binding domain-containing protein [Planctomycetes bacterium]|nr:FAD binding domain-containing protein [Planctomycetota bacterium]